MDFYPLTQSQQLIYDMDKFAGGSIANICGSMLFKEPYSAEEIQAAIYRVYKLNDALRFRIKENNGAVQQYINDEYTISVEKKCFESKEELDLFGKTYAKEPIVTGGSLCEFIIATLPEQTGVIVKLHHLIGDAWTLSLLGSQLNSIIRGETPEAYSYIDHINSEENYLSGKRYQKDREFFETQFKSFDESTFLSEKQTDSYIAERKTFTFSKEQTDRLHSFAKCKGVSPFNVLLTAFSVYFSRVKMNAEQFYFGTAVLNRAGTVEQNTAGMFINTVPILINLKNESSFSENLQTISDTAFSALRHEKFNYGALLSFLRKQYSFNEKLYDVVFSFQNATVDGECESTWYPCCMQTESLQIHAEDRDRNGTLQIHYDYLTDKFTAQEIEAMHSRICNLLFDAINNDDKKPYELNILSPEERQKVQFDFNDTAADYPKEKCVHELFEMQADSIPDSIAVVAADKALTYRKLNDEANRIAHSLIAKGVKDGDIVAVILQRTSHLIPALFGVLKTGAAYLPLDPSYPQERIDYLISESGASCIINEENINSFVSSNKSDNPQINVPLDALFCALHTSGSTGKPKVTALTQQNLLNFLYANTDFWDNVETVITVTIVTFDIFMQDTLLSLALGKKVILASNEQIFNQSEFEKMFENEENVMFFSTPTKLQSYIKRSEKADFLLKIRSLIVGGEVFTDELYDLLISKIKPDRFKNGYGPAENTIGVSYTDNLPSKKIPNQNI